MGWRCVVIESPCKVSCAGNYLIIRSDDVKKIHLSEIYCLIISTTNVTLTGVSLCELSKRNIKTLFCDEKHNPYGEISNYFGSHNTTKRIKKQISWKRDTMQSVAYEIIKRKILNQAALLLKIGENERGKMLINYAKELLPGDPANREGHAAKVYFNTLFGVDFNRNVENTLNSALNYGYTVLLSCINREIAVNGCLTQLGILHSNEFNDFNLSCDIIEPFRVIVDEFVFRSKDRVFDSDYKHDLINLLNIQISTDEKNVYLHNAISYYVKSTIDALDNDNLSLLRLFKFI